MQAAETRSGAFGGGAQRPPQRVGSARNPAILFAGHRARSRDRGRVRSLLPRPCGAGTGRGRSIGVWYYGIDMVKVTYSLDDATVRRIRTIAGRLGIPQSQMVREAVADYAARKDRLSEAERLRMLEVLYRLRDTPPRRSRAEVEAELREIRDARRRGWRPER